MVELSKNVMNERGNLSSYPSYPAPNTTQKVTGIELLSGPIASIGKGESVIGRAKIVTNPERADFQPGDILVAEHTDPNYTGLFRIAGGVITDTGGITSHASITAREFRIPAIVGAIDATKKIKDGDLIMIDISPMRAGKREGKIIKVA